LKIAPDNEAAALLPRNGLAVLAGSRPGVGVSHASEALRLGLIEKGRTATILDAGTVGEWADQDKPRAAADLVVLVVHHGCLPGHVHQLAARLMAAFRAGAIIIRHRAPTAET